MNGRTEERRAWSIPIARVMGIPIYLHFTFVLLIGWLALRTPQGQADPYPSALLALVLFACVALHELGHAAMARRFGIKTRDIVLYPIGGVARLQSMGAGFQEFWIAIAGPAVNLVIAGAIFAFLRATGQWVPMMQALDSAARAGEASGQEVAFLDFVPFWQEVAFINIGLLVFNLVPAFPMDGGRVLRAILARFMSRTAATDVAAMFGQLFAVLFIAGGLTQTLGPTAVLIGVFIFLAARQEAAGVRTVEILGGHFVRDAMITRFTTLSHADSLAKASEMLLRTNQQEFPVSGGSEIVGMLERRGLIEGLAQLGGERYVAEAMTRDFIRMRPDEPLQKAAAILQNPLAPPILVFAGETLAGYVNRENLIEYMMVAQAEARRGR